MIRAIIAMPMLLTFEESRWQTKQASRMMRWERRCPGLIGLWTKADSVTVFDGFSFDRYG